MLLGTQMTVYRPNFPIAWQSAPVSAAAVPPSSEQVQGTLIARAWTMTAARMLELWRASKVRRMLRTLALPEQEQMLVQRMLLWHRMSS